MNLEAQERNKLKRKMDNNEALIKRHENKVAEHIALRSKRRFKSVAEMEQYLARISPIDGLEYSYAEKCNILREQVQLRKKLDGVGKIGNIVLHNFSNSEKYPDPLPKLLELFTIICERENLHGIPTPVRPQLLECRKSMPGEDSLAKALLERQHAQAQALTNAFYE